ncbi:MAG: zinc-dependent dehydrogenase [Methanocellales archaeon]|nr:zinc-dependent dehydrogenase [Methanocellales archaeon]MDD5447240.1 zinc-dependent dehydrogenase [Methanocellales archaeon]
MRVAMYYSNDDVRLEEMPIPQISSGELLVKVIASGICGSDVMEWYRIRKAPLVLGHEITGEIVEMGKDVKKYKKGDRVFVSHHVPCNTCRYCLSDHQTACETLHKTNYDPGGFAEFIRVPQINVEMGVFLLPEGISFDEGTFIEPLACVARGLRLANMKPGLSVLIMGSGISGLLHIQLAKALGAERIIATDMIDYRLRAAKKFGADATIHAKENVPVEVRKMNEGRPVDRVIICTGALPAALQAIQSVDRGGTVLFFAVPEPDVDVPVPMNELWRNEITLMTSYGAGPKDIQTAIELIGSRKINVKDMITHKFGLKDTSKGFKLVADAKESLKVIIEPQR